MSKQTTYNKVQNITLNIRLNEISSGLYVPVTIVTNMQAVTTDGGLRDVQTRTEVGTPRETEYTPTELAALVKGSANSTGNFLLTELTNAYNNALGGLI